MAHEHAEHARAASIASSTQHVEAASRPNTSCQRPPQSRPPGRLHKPHKKRRDAYLALSKSGANTTIRREHRWAGAVGDPERPSSGG